MVNLRAFNGSPSMFSSLIKQQPYCHMLLQTLQLHPIRNVIIFFSLFPPIAYIQIKKTKQNLSVKIVKQRMNIILNFGVYFKRYLMT